MDNNKSVNLPEKLYKMLSSHLKNSSFKSVEDFVVYILQEYLDRQNSDSNDKKQSSDDAAVLKRLEDLGYM